MQKNENVTLRITGTTSDGLGVGHVEGRSVFLPGALEGELWKAGITKVSANTVYARRIELLEASPHRIEPDCPYFGRCGGCDFRHMDYGEELRVKANRVRDALQRIGGLDVEKVPIAGAENIDHYRNKAVFHVRQGKNGPEIGFFRSRTHEIIPAEHCRLQSPAADAARAAVQEWMERYHISGYDETHHTGYVRSLLVRTSSTGQALVCLAVNDEKLPRTRELVFLLQTRVPGLATVVQSIHTRKGNAVLGSRFLTLWGPGWIEDTLCGCRFRISSASFYQVNHDQAERLYGMAAAAAAVSKTDTVLDLYCGTGTIGLTMADAAGRLLGVEIVPQAVDDAKVNASLNHAGNSTFYCEDASAASQRFAADGVKPGVIILDPPRKGLSIEVIDSVTSMSPDRVVYISCDPATLARDLKLFSERGFTCHSIHAVDLFPRCSHVETVVLMTKK